MARPRIFISSTYFDLRVLRADLERFIKEMSFEPVLFEKGHIPYGKEKALEDYCYREISTCDILIAIIGGKYGSQSRDQENSITQREIKTAIELGKQIYVFVERSVHMEYKTYQNNKDIEGFKPASVNDKRIFKFIEEIYALPSGNPIEAFETSEDITRFLREQWAGLFQRLLQEAARQKEMNIIERLNATASTLDKLVTYLAEERSKGDQAIKDILLSSHPAFTVIKNVARIPHRVVFQNLSELNALLTAYGYIFDSSPFDNEYYEWDHSNTGQVIRVSRNIFDGVRLKIYTPDDWDNSWIQQYIQPLPDEDLPF